MELRFDGFYIYLNPNDMEEFVRSGRMFYFYVLLFVKTDFYLYEYNPVLLPISKDVLMQETIYLNAIRDKLASFTGVKIDPKLSIFNEDLLNVHAHEKGRYTITLDKYISGETHYVIPSSSIRVSVKIDGWIKKECLDLKMDIRAKSSQVEKIQDLFKFVAFSYKGMS